MGPYNNFGNRERHQQKEVIGGHPYLQEQASRSERIFGEGRHTSDLVPDTGQTGSRFVRSNFDLTLTCGEEML